MGGANPGRPKLRRQRGGDDAPDDSYSVDERRRAFLEVSSGDFEHELERIWDGITAVRESVVEAVREEKLTPIEGVSILACTTGQLLGYQAFHGQPEPTALLPYFGGRQ